MVVMLGLDWPTEDLSDVLQAYHFHILGRERQVEPAPWWTRSARTADGRLVPDPEATWTKTHYTFRREFRCESCGERFGYNFEVDQVSQVRQEGRSTDGSLRLELGRQLRRRVRCPRCGAVQKEPRRMLLRADRRQMGLACSLVVLGAFLFAGLGLLGGWLGGISGFFVGLLVALGIILGIWFFAFTYLLSIGSAI
jgi:hypothetical protein